MRWRYHLRAYSGRQHKHSPVGELLILVRLADRVALQMEEGVCRARMERGEIGYWTVVDTEDHSVYRVPPSGWGDPPAPKRTRRRGLTKTNQREEQI